MVGGDNLFECCGCILGPFVSTFGSVAIVRQRNSGPTISRPRACTASIPRSDVPPCVMWKVTTAVSDLCVVRAGLQFLQLNLVSEQVLKALFSHYQYS